MVSRHLSRVAMGNKAVSTAVMGLHRHRGGGLERLHPNSVAMIDDDNPVASVKVNGVESADVVGADRVLVMKLGMVSGVATLTSHKIVCTHYRVPSAEEVLIASSLLVSSQDIQVLSGFFKNRSGTI